MTVKKLIEELQKQDQNARVVFKTEDEEEVIFCLSYMNRSTDKVFLASEFDYDMTEEINARFEYAMENDVDETEFYSDLLEVGINVGMVEKYLGKEQASHMKDYCEEHGLL